MLDARLLPLQQALLRPVARVLVRAGVDADRISLAGFALGIAGVAAIALGQSWVGLVLILLNRIFDGLDGAVARLAGPTDRGAFLDVALDFVFYALVPLGFAFADPAANALAAATLIATFVGTGSSFLAFATIAAKQGRTAADFPAKGIYYLGGLTEGFETVAIFAIMCIFPASFAVLASVFAAACAVTTLLRWHQGWTLLKDAAPQA